MPPRARPTTEPYPLDPTLDFMRLLWAIEHGLQKRSKRMRSELGITGPQRLVLRIVSRYPGISAGDVARLIKLHPSTVTGVLQRLVAAGLLKREPDPGDSRRVRLWILPRAERHARSLGGTVEETVRRVLRRCRGSDVAVARAVLAGLARELSE
jgi:MarR family transcriptional regulator, organic hydroperoxide resistance regulator